MNLHEKVRDFTKRTVEAMGLALDVSVVENAEGLRVDLSGEEGEALLRRRGEGLEALQHILSTAFRRDLPHEKSFVVDCMGYRAARDAELREMARFTMEKAKSTGVPQEMGPLNPYARRVVHLTVAEDPAMASESIGDAFLKTVVISARK
jgi:spoIIIJ-associated protein